MFKEMDDQELYNALGDSDFLKKVIVELTKDIRIKTKVKEIIKKEEAKIVNENELTFGTEEPIETVEDNVETVETEYPADTVEKLKKRGRKKKDS